jgi:hypothetical protein
MEIEFTVQIDPEKRGHECHAALAFVTAGTLSLLLVGLLCPPLWLCLTGAWVPMSLACFKRYRKMRSQERAPDKLRIENESLVYISGGKKSFSIPLSTICRIETGTGLQIFVKGQKKLTVLDPRFALSKFLATSKRQKCDLFFEWFGPSVKPLLENIMHAH